MLPMKKRMISYIITCSMLFATIPVQLASAEEVPDFDPQSLLRQDFHDYSVEPAADELVWDTEPVEFPVATQEPLELPEEIDYAAKLQFLGGLASSQQGIVTALDEYYQQHYAPDPPPAGHLETYFSAGAMERLFLESVPMQQLLLCLLDEASADDALRDDLKELIESGISIQSAARAYLRHQNYQGMGLPEEAPEQTIAPENLPAEQEKTEMPEATQQPDDTPADPTVEDNILSPEDSGVFAALPAQSQEASEDAALEQELAEEPDLEAELNEPVEPVENELEAPETEGPASEEIAPEQTEPAQPEPEGALPEQLPEGQEPQIMPEQTAPVAGPPEEPPLPTEEPPVPEEPLQTEPSLEENILAPYLSNIKSTLSFSDASGFELYEQQKYEGGKYKKDIGGDVSISDRNGGLSYQYPLLSIPGKNNSSMDLSLNYGVLDAEVFYVSYEDTSTGWGDYIYYPQKVSAIGSGWSFNLTHIDPGNGFSGGSGYLVLFDGRSIDLNTRASEGGYPYTDIIYENNCVTYLDGTKEYLNADNYVQYRDDKYGNRITYTYDTVEGYEPRLTSMSDNMGHTITITYGSAYTEITRPDGSKIRLKKTERTPVTEQITHCKANVHTEVLDQIYDVDTNTELGNFTYQAMDSRTFIGSAGSPGNYILAEDYITHMAMMTAQSPYSGSRQFTYITPGSNNSVQTGRQSSNLAVQTCKQDGKLYLTYSYPPTTDNNTWFMRGSTAVTADNMVTETIYNSGSIYADMDSVREENLYRRDGNVDHLKQYTQYLYGKITDTQYTDAMRPYEVTQKLYNDNGNYITTKTESSYNNKGQVLTQKQTVENAVKQVIENTYSTNAYSSLLQSTIKNGSNIPLTTAVYAVNSYGDITRQEVREGSATGTLAANTDYFYSGNNLARKEIKDGSTLLEREYYSYYNKAYLTQVRVANASGSTIEGKYYDYDSIGRLIHTYDGVIDEEITYNALGQITKEKHWDGSSKTILYYPIDNSYQITDENQYKVEYFYSGVGGNLSSIEEVMPGYQDLKTFSYDAMGRPISVQDALKNKTTVSYDIFGRQTAATFPQIGTTAVSPLRAKYYDVFLEGSTKYTMAMKISQTGKISCNYYDVYGRLAKTAVVKNPSVLTNLSNLDSIYQMPSNVQLQVTASYTYDALDRVTCETDGEGRTTRYTYDALGNVLTMEKGTGAEKTTISYTYNKAGRLIKTVQGTHITTNEYDYAGRLTKTTDPMGFTETYTYDTAGNILTAKDKNGMLTYNTYNNRGLLEKVKKGTQTIEYTYDPTGNLLTSKDEGGTITYRYNTDGTLASKQYPDGKKISYTSYNKNKQLTGMIDYLGNTTTYTYTGGSYIQSIAQKMSGTSTTNTANYSYYADGSLKKMDYPNGMSTDYSYNYANQISTLENRLSSSSTYSTHNYTYDLSGNVTKKSETVSGTNKNIEYSYDSQNRLSYEGTPGSYDYWHYAYDQYGNLTSAIGNGDKYYTYDANNRLTKMEDQWTTKKLPDGSGVQADWTMSYTYDMNGTLKSESRTADTGSQVITNAGTKTYTYDKFARMTGYTDNTGGSATYTYYSDGLRASKTTGSDTIRYYYNGQDVINETKNNANYATNTMGVDGFISRTQSGTTGYLFHDAHGDIKAAYSSSKTKLADYTYDAWGNQTAANNSGWSQGNPIRYNGQYYDAESGMTYLRARYYNSNIQRFTTEDPAKDGMNWYSYCSNNPVMFVDPWGLDDYIFYGDDQKGFAEDLQKSLQEKDHVVHMIYVETPDDFYNGWASMGTDKDGNTVSIDTVYIHVHGEPEYIKSSNGESIYANKLAVKKIDTILLTACNTGHMDFENNFASQLAMSQNVNQVIAPDGLGLRLGIGSASSNYFPEYSNIERAGNGFTIYQNIQNTLLITPNLTKDTIGITFPKLIAMSQAATWMNRSYYNLREKTMNVNQLMNRILGLE